LRDIVTAAARPRREELLAAADRIRAMTPPGNHVDSVQLIREDRDR
jgi:hypothetical protein